MTPRPGRSRAKATGQALRRLSLLAASVVLASLAFTAVAQASPNGYLLQFGSPGGGDGQFTPYGPIGMAVDPTNGDVYVSDYANNRVEKFDSSGNYLLQFGGLGSGPGQMNGPIGIALDPTNEDVYVTDFFNNRVEKFDPSGNFVSQFGTEGQTDGQFEGPNGIAVDPHNGDIWVTDRYNNRVEKFDPSGNYLRQFGSGGTGPGQFSLPVAAAVDPSNSDVYVSDYNSNRVQKFDSSGNFLSQFGSLGTGNGQVHGAYGLSVDPVTSDLYVTDFNNNRVQRFDSSGNYLSQFGSGGTGPGQFNEPIAIVVAPGSRNVYVADWGNARVEEFASEASQSASSTALASSANPALFGQSVTFTATVTGGGPAPTGSVSFSDGSTPLGTGTVSGGVAKVTVSSLTLGSHAITATYGGDANYAGSTSSPVNEVIQETPTGLCQLTLTDVQGSAKYQALPANARAAINQIVTGACNQLGTIVPRLTAKQLAQAIAGYDAAVRLLSSSGWLTSAQASTLTSLANNLTI
jgi:DNA-binding beta-propeller fold protein YncE